MNQEEAIFRSADMTYVQLYIPLEVIREVTFLLGKMSVFMVMDLNKDLTAFQRGYVNQLRRFDEVERMVGFLNEVVEKHAAETWKYILHIDDEGNDIAQPDMADLINTMEPLSLENVNDMVKEITDCESRARQLDESLDSLRSKLNDLLEQRQVIFECSKFIEVNPGIAGRATNPEIEQEERDVDEFRMTPDDISETLSDAFSFDDETPQDRGALGNDLTRNQSVEDLSFLEQGYQHRYMITGSIRRTKVDILNRILWRLLRGNLIFQNFPIEEPLLEGKEKVEKDCFIIFTHGETLLKKVKRVIDSLNGKIVSLNTRSSELVDTLNRQIDDLQRILDTTEQTLHTELLVIHDQLPVWSAMTKREKYVYTTLNKFQQESQGLIAEGWVPSTELIHLQDSLKDYIETLGSEYSTVFNVILTNKLPPTYHRTNKFTQAFQSIVDAYGIATYKEINAGLATVVTFPFMFAIMFGDMGHGFILFLMALFLVLNERKFGAMHRDEIFDMAFTGRYVLLLMGAFSVYTGLLYNDIFSKSMTIFKSGWQWPSTFRKGESIEAKKTGVYPFGLDFAWHGTDNGLLFSNSYKMKLSILMGYAHMTYSFMFSYINYRAKNSKVDIIGNFIPGLVFMQSIFGYLSWAIVYKWSKDWIKDDKPAPGLLNMLINMFLAPGTIDDQLYSGQAKLQVVLLLAALVCVPWLLLYKPLTLRRLNKNGGGGRPHGYQSVGNIEHEEQIAQQRHSAEGFQGMIISDVASVADSINESVGGGEQGPFNFGDLMIHQVIHTIEFCLNCISHTASYLRLWALSLAHAQLSSVLWDMTISNAFSSKNSGSPLAVMKVVILFAMWFVLTVCILVFMEGTSAMLHALRLHWVEAMSKFFEGEGYAYEPFSFRAIIE
ncbi:ASG_G0040840.mRNA.1.CDS.1 [Saccharomyces cerevisiae]|nr:ASG_G0040840.mRNA.1.CDS.1 [Saccharomyces cerevisiae]CAI7266801.1 ASG_G0040840.mRNA.1.CDS.1 [Saccharomyces cerevisiae]